MWMMFAPVAGDIDAAGKPNMVVPLHMIEEFHQPGKAGRPPDQAAMEPDRHHLRRHCTLVIQLSKASIR